MKTKVQRAVKYIEDIPSKLEKVPGEIEEYFSGKREKKDRFQGILK